MKNINVHIQNEKTLLYTSLTTKQHLLQFLFKLRLAALLFAILVLLILLTICYYGNMKYKYHYHPLHDILYHEKQSNQNLQKILNQKNLTKIMIKSNYYDSMKVYLEHYAISLLQNDQNVVVYNIREKEVPIEPFVGIVYHKIRKWMGYNSSTTRIFILKEPTKIQQIQQLMKLYPQDRFIVAESKNIQYQQLDGFELAQFHNFDENTLLKVLVSTLKISKIQAKAVFKYFQDSSKLFELIQSNYIDGVRALRQALVQGKYSSIEQIAATKNQKLLQKLCKNGTTVGKNSKYLISLGVKFVEKNIYWQNNLAMLNYQLQTNQLCEQSGVYMQQQITTI